MDPEVLRPWGFEGAVVEPWGSGLINATFRVTQTGQPYILQRIHRVFRPEVHFDIDAVTSRIAECGMETPRIVPTRDGALWSSRGGEIWRVLTFVHGETHQRATDRSMTREAGRLVAQFHRALADFDHAFHFSRPDAHNTALHLANLRAALESDAGKDVEAKALGAQILEAGESLPVVGELPSRVIHGDLKLNNILFRGPEAVALVDLDTVGRQTIAVELGDALRSWCNPAGEDASHTASVDLEIYGAALEGYAAGAPGFLTPAEIDAIGPGLETISLELASRFCRDVIDDAYFGWDSTRYGSRREHNLVRAQSQLRLAQAAHGVRADLVAIAREALR